MNESRKSHISKTEPNWENRTLFHGDNLDFLRSMNSESVHLIATDPPFKKNRDSHATPDSLASGASFQDRWKWERDVHVEWIDRIEDDYPKVMNVIQGSRNSYGDDMGAFLCFMAVRLLSMWRILRQDGSIYLHCDPTASHYLKELMDSIFGKDNFRNEIVWCYAGGGIPRNDFPRKHDIILRYTKSNRYTFNPIWRPYSEGTQQRGRTQVKGKYYDLGLNKKGTPVNDWWSDVKRITSPTDPEKTGWPTQKSLDLYERIIKASSNEGEVVLDPFCGCATTLVAAERLGRQWVGIDIWDKAHETVIARLKGEGLLGPDGETSGGLFSDGRITYKTDPPKRTDDGKVAASILEPIIRREWYKWERLTHKEIVGYLVEARNDGDLVVCGGCGRKLEKEFMELDHVLPRKDGGTNDITNRILLCRPCNGRKSAQLTLTGLRTKNKEVGWMSREGDAERAHRRAQRKAENLKATLC